MEFSVTLFLRHLQKIANDVLNKSLRGTAINAKFCGASDGAINIFEIPQSKFSLSQSLGFASLSTLPNAQETQCR